VAVALSDNFVNLKRAPHLLVILIANIIYTAFMVWLICLFFTFLESLWEERKIKYLFGSVYMINYAVASKLFQR